jgi:hypothetical protein
LNRQFAWEPRDSREPSERLAFRHGDGVARDYHLLISRDDKGVKPRVIARDLPGLGCVAGIPVGGERESDRSWNLTEELPQFRARIFITFGFRSYVAARSRERTTRERGGP